MTSKLDEALNGKKKATRNIIKEVFIMKNMDSELLNYIAKVTQRPLNEQLAFFNENVDLHPVEMISCVRALAEATVSYLFFSVAKTNQIPGPYWCLIFKSNEYRCFSDECDKNKRRGHAYPENYQKMWKANQLLKTVVPETFIAEANSVKKLGNMVLHNNPRLATMDLPREARKCLDSYEYLLSEVNRVVSSAHKGDRPGTGNRNGRNDVASGDIDHFSKARVKEVKDSFSSFDINKWFAGVQAELAMERAKTQEDYDIEDENY